jgi:hypothetical protein
MPPGYDLHAINRTIVADLIRGRRALRPLPTASQETGTAVSLLPPQASERNNLLYSAQVASDNELKARARALREAERVRQRDETVAARLELIRNNDELAAATRSSKRRLDSS